MNQNFISMNKQEVVDLLAKETANILYRKKDGSERVIKATLQESVVPQTTGTNASAQKDTHVNVFDVEKSQWRTLIIDSIIHLGQRY